MSLNAKLLVTLSLAAALTTSVAFATKKVDAVCGICLYSGDNGYCATNKGGYDCRVYTAPSGRPACYNAGDCL